MNLEPGDMVNFYPETPDDGGLKSGENPSCVLGSKPGTGFLDGSSKHFMLVQGPETAIPDYNARLWKEKEVQYAGEISVYITDSTCYYTINSNSGTYRPHAADPHDPNNRFGYLDKVASLFDQIVNTYPAFESYFDYGLQRFIDKPVSAGRNRLENCNSAD